MNEQIRDIADRIRGMRDILGIPEEEMAAMLEMTVGEYAAYERGERDFPFTFLYKAAGRFGIDMTDLLSGRSPMLAGFTVCRKGEGLPIERRHGFHYESLAHHFKDRISEPFLVDVPYDEAAIRGEIPMNTHPGQEFDYVLRGSLRIRIDGHETILHAGDSVYYDAGLRHGMTALEGGCTFLAIIMNIRRNG